MILFRKYTYGKLAFLHFTERLFGKPSPHEVTFAYEPYLMFRAADITSDPVNVSGFRRKSVPDVHATTTSPDTIDIYFFGSSTMYGEGLNDEQTIPSQFVKHYQASNPARSIRVHNFGVPHYYSKQQLMLLS